MKKTTTPIDSSIQLLNFLVENSSEGMVVFDRSGLIKLANTSAKQLLCLQSIDGVRFQDLYGGVQTSFLCAGSQVFEANGSYVQYPTKLQKVKIVTHDDYFVAYIKTTAPEPDTAQSTANLRAIFDNAPQIFLAYNKDIELLYHNNTAKKWFARYYGIDIDKQTERVAAFGELDWFYSSFNKALSGEKVIEEIKPKTTISKARWFEVYFSPWYNEDRDVIGVIIGAMLIEVRKNIAKQLMKAKNNLKAMFDSSPQIYMLIAADGRLLTYNKKAQSYFSINLENVTDTNYSLFESDDCIFRPIIQDNYSRAIRGERISIEFSIANANKSQTWYDANLLPVFDGRDNLFAVAFSANDITYRKEADEKLKKSEAQLRELNAAKDKFMSIIAHDLRSPFAALMNLSQLIIASFDDLSKAEVLEMHDLMYKSSEQAIALIENLLLWSRSQSGMFKLKNEAILIAELAAEAISYLATQASNKNITLVNGCLPQATAWADRNMISTVIRNLASNALKFTPEGGTVTIGAYPADNMLGITVSDSGIGIDNAMIPTLFHFDNHYTTQGTANEKGTGLGLIICREFVEKNGGTITVKSTPNEGSIFTFTLPLV